MNRKSCYTLLKSITSISSTVLMLSIVHQTASAQCPPPSQVGAPNGLTAAGKDMRTEHTQPWCDPVCVVSTTGGTSCKNAAGNAVSTLGVCNDGIQAQESIKDIEYNLCINIDQQFINDSTYQGLPPGGDYTIPTADAAFYFATLFSVDSNGNGVIDGPEATAARDRGWSLANELNSNGDNIITRNEAGAVKGADDCQLLSTGFTSGLATDDILSYIGLYLGDPMIDKYAGDLEGEDDIKEKLLHYSRTWQPSYWKRSNGSAIVGGKSGVHEFWDTEFSGDSRRVCDAGYTGPYKALYELMKDGTSGGTNPDDDNDDNTGGGSNPNLSDYLDSSCGSSHPYRCPSSGACFTAQQMSDYCGISGAPSNPQPNEPIDDPADDDTSTPEPSDNCSDSHPFWCASRGQCFTEQQMNTYCQ